MLPSSVLAGPKLKRRRLTESGVTGLTRRIGHTRTVLTSRIGHTRTGLARRTSHARTALAGPRVRRGTGTGHALSWPLRPDLGLPETALGPDRGPLTGPDRGTLTWETLTGETLTWAELGLALLAEEALDGQALARLADVALHR